MLAYIQLLYEVEREARNANAEHVAIDYTLSNWEAPSAASAPSWLVATTGFFMGMTKAGEPEPY
jgi:hypothetical protein